MISIKNQEEIEIMRRGGRLLAKIVEAVKNEAKPGVSTAELDKLAEKLINETGGQASFKMVPKYKWATCMCVNEVVVHGIPNNYRLREGDILGIDIGLFYEGFHSDASWTVLIGRDEKKEKFLRTGEEALKRAILQSVPGNRIGHISRTIGRIVGEAGYSPVRALVGHGIGKDLHEEPQIPCFLKGSLNKTPKLEEGMTLAIEVIYNQGAGGVIYRDNDGWTIQTIDGELSGLFEHTIAVLGTGPEILTQPS